MTMPRTLLPFLAVAMLALIVGACGSDESSSTSSSGSSKPANATTDDAAPAPAPGTPEAAEAKLEGSGAFALTPEIATCMKQAGFTQDAPPTGGLVAWRGPDGSRAVVASSGDVTLGIASEIGTEAAPANVDGTVVVAGPAAQVSAAQKCLAG